jgi:hypothetical protein
MVLIGTDSRRNLLTTAPRGTAVVCEFCAAERISVRVCLQLTAISSLNQPRRRKAIRRRALPDAAGKGHWWLLVLSQLLNRSSVNIMMTLSSHMMSTRRLLSTGPSTTAFKTARCRIVTGRRWPFSEMMSRVGLFKRYDLPCMGASFYREGRGTPSACVYDEAPGSRCSNGDRSDAGKQVITCTALSNRRSSASSRATISV